jgi:hypothetical protein
MHTNCSFELGFKGGLALGCGRFVNKQCSNVVCGLNEKLDHKSLHKKSWMPLELYTPNFGYN